MKLEWERFKRHRRVSLNALIIKNEIQDYEQLVRFLAIQGVLPPDESTFLEAYQVARPSVSESVPQVADIKEVVSAVEDASTPGTVSDPPPKKKRKRKSTKVAK